MNLTRTGQFVNVMTKQVENILDFDDGQLIISISDTEYQRVLNHLQKAQPTFYVNEQQVHKDGFDEDGVKAL